VREKGGGGEKTVQRGLKGGEVIRSQGTKDFWKAGKNNAKAICPFISWKRRIPIEGTSLGSAAITKGRGARGRGRGKNGGPQRTGAIHLD